ncbi:hypothetical protein KOR34_25090 [Posidoniimonas corsicana]|uniref:Uncharacterized protein n=1 Tax=Posidoniimonas corsicana TaxID=1938618 RepID=A0A5C5VG61_9BACT|nr:hypothetical protein [Posidoniimonas corsicana]TWT37556.1 hypothetical protein KOR34_25090 [Posidoniimonas corsicana]
MTNPTNGSSADPSPAENEPAGGADNLPPLSEQELDEMLLIPDNEADAES